MKFSLIIVFLFIFSCGEKKENDSSNFLEIYYLDEGMHFSSRVECGSFHSKWYSERRHYKKVDNKEFVNKFLSFYQKLENTNEKYGVDTRIQVILHSEKKLDTICLGEHFSILVNGELKKDSPEMLKFLKAEIYNQANSR